jgi:hypothetical protein
MGKHGGVRENAGRKPKADEIKIIEQMDAVLAPIEVWQKLAELVSKGDGMAIKTWLSYRFGNPKQTLDLGGEIRTTTAILNIDPLSDTTDDSITKDSKS